MEPKGIQTHHTVGQTQQCGNIAAGTKCARLLKLHQQFGHVSFRRLKLMATQGVIPKRLAKCDVPACTACLYAKAAKRPWRSKTTPNYKPPESPTGPGRVLSVDQMVSPTPGLVAQMAGYLTTKRYKYETVFVDQYSKMGFTFRQKT